MKKYVYIILLLMLFNGCREAVPDQYVDMMTTIRIEPDYRDTVIPCNIAPLMPIREVRLSLKSI